MVHFLISSRLPSFLLQSERTANENAAEERSSSLSVQVRRLAPPTAAAAPALERGLPVQDDAWIANVEGSKRRGDRGDRGEERAAQNEELSADVIAGDWARAPRHILRLFSRRRRRRQREWAQLGIRSISLLPQQNERAAHLFCRLHIPIPEK